MKKIFGIYRKYMFRPMLYKTVTKFVVCIAIVLLWDRYLNTGGFPVAEYGCFCVGGIVALLAWFEYLRLDGMVVHHLNEDIRPKKKERHRSKDIADFVDEKIVSYSELEPEERALCRLLSDLLCGGLLLIPGFISLFF